MSAAGPEAAPARSCGGCSLCCTVLRVDELAKLGGRPCLHQQQGGGCAVHDRRPGVCRAYRCAWLGGAFDEADRPDHLGAVLDLVPRGTVIHLVVRQARPDALAGSPRLQSIVERHREAMPVELRDVEDVLDGDRPVRVLLPGGVEHLVEGEQLTVLREGRVVEQRRAPWLERWVRRIARAIGGARLRRWPDHARRMAELGLPAGADAALAEEPEGPDDPARGA